MNLYYSQPTMIKVVGVLKLCETILLYVRHIVIGSNFLPGGVISVLFRYLDLHQTSGIKVWSMQVSDERVFLS